ncbi:MAG: hypothetical protein ACJAW3_000429 [Lentimonas sp.]|jgi:hypothetical protein
MKNLSLTTLTFLLFCDNYSLADTAEGTASANIVAPISVKQTTALNFGSFSSTGSPGTIDEKGQAQGGVTSVSSGQAGVFTVEGLTSGGYEFDIPTTAVISDRISGSNQMTVNLASDTEGTLNSSSGGSSASNITVTGVLDVDANQAIGEYSGTYPVTVNYK